MGGLKFPNARTPSGLKTRTFEQWMTNRFGQRLFRIFFKTYTEKVWGIPCSEIRADWAAQRIKGLSLLVAVSNALFGGQQAKSLIEEFNYPRFGPGMMWKSFMDRIVAGNGEVMLNAEVSAIHHSNAVDHGNPACHRHSIRSTERLILLIRRWRQAQTEGLT